MDRVRYAHIVCDKHVKVWDPFDMYVQTCTFSLYYPTLGCDVCFDAVMVPVHP